MQSSSQVLGLAQEIGKLNPIIKVNSALRREGYDLINWLRKKGAKVFADLKLHDIKQTEETDGTLLETFAPDILTVMAQSGVEGMRALKLASDPGTKVIAVGVLTSLTEKDFDRMYPGRSVIQQQVVFLEMALEAGLDGFVCAGTELSAMRKLTGADFELIVPGIRPVWAEVKNDDQRRVTTIAEALGNGATRVVIGRPITQAENRAHATKLSIEEIASVLATQGGA